MQRRGGDDSIQRLAAVVINSSGRERVIGSVGGLYQQMQTGMGMTRQYGAAELESTNAS